MGGVTGKVKSFANRLGEISQKQLAAPWLLNSRTPEVGFLLVFPSLLLGLLSPTGALSLRTLRGATLVGESQGGVGDGGGKRWSGRRGFGVEVGLGVMFGKWFLFLVKSDVGCKKVMNLVFRGGLVIFLNPPFSWRTLDLKIYTSLSEAARVCALFISKTSVRIICGLSVRLRLARCDGGFEVEVSVERLVAVELW